jgi:hypothetical protein
MVKNISSIALFLACLTVSLFAANLSAADYLDFAGWDHGQILNGGQTFTDICGDLDVFVEGVGAFDADSTFEMTMAGGDSAIRSEITGAGSQTFKFTFSTPIDVFVDFSRLDSEEMLGVYGIGPEIYSHLSGNNPFQMPDNSGVKLQGDGFGVNAADGRVSSGPTSVLTISYSATIDGPTKYLDFNVGKLAVPEPGSFSLLGLGVLFGLQMLRRRR